MRAPTTFARRIGARRAKELLQSPDLLELHNAVRQSDVPTALAALSRCDGETNKAPPRSIYNRLLALVLAQPEHRNYVQAHMKSAGVEPDESTLTLAVRALVQEGELQAAVEMLSETTSFKLRTAAPVLHALLDRRELRRASALRARMSHLGVALGEEERIRFLVASAAAGAATSKSTEAAADGSAGSSSGGDAFVPPPISMQLRELQREYTTLRPASLAMLLSETALDARLTTVSDDGVCSSSGARLRVLPLDASERDGLTTALLDAASAAGEGIGENLRAFGKWVRGLSESSSSSGWSSEQSSGGDAAAESSSHYYVIDGANAGYRHQNVEGGAFSFHQIELARRALKEKGNGREPIIVLPTRYLDEESRQVPNHTMWRAGQAERFTRLSDDDLALVKSWKTEGNLWATPDGYADDWYWMYATLLLGEGGRVLTCDQMRDHLFHLTLGKPLERWKTRHVVRFDFSSSDPEGAERVATEINLHEPPLYSHEIQVESVEDGTGERWHLPSHEEEDSPGSRGWLCLRVE